MPSDLARKIERLLPRVSKPARYAGSEWNEVRKSHQEVDVTFALAFPDVYEVGMSHLGSKILYHELNKRQDTAAERVFSPWTDMEGEMRTAGVPLFSLETRTPVRDFDFLGITLQYELTYTNTLNLLDLAGIPLKTAGRTDEHPLVIGGGPCAFNPEPLAGFFDLFAIGDGEEIIHEIIEVYKRWKVSEGRPGGRAEILDRLSRIEGIYVPSFYAAEYGTDGRVKQVDPIRAEAPFPIRRRVVEDLDEVDLPTRPVVPYLDVVHDRAMLEVFRGCTRGCRFCHAGTVYRPVRERSPEKVLRYAEELLRGTGHDELSLVSLSSSDYSGIKRAVRELVDRYEKEGVGVSLPSLRVDTFSVGLAGEVQKLRKGGLTLAPEAGSQRLRDVINKGVTEEDIFSSVRAAFEAGWTAVKLYFMIGLPTETDEDLDGIAHLAHGIIHIYQEVTAGKKAKPPRITVSVSSFVPKAHTPFQWEPQVPVDELQRRQKYLVGKLRDRRIEFNWHDSRVSFIEAVFSRGDRRLAAALEAAWKKGCKFDGWTELFKYEAWLEAFAETGTDPGFYADRRREYDEVFPWDHIESGLDKGFLIEDHRRALRGQLIPDCRWNPCGSCGVCPTLNVWINMKGEPGVAENPPSAQERA